jgi:hypothetical protein
MGVGKKTNTLYIPHVVAQMMMTHRKTFTAKVHSLESFLEDGLMRLRAADSLLAMTGDQAKHDDLVRQIVEWLRPNLEASPEQLAGKPPANTL